VGTKTFLLGEVARSESDLIGSGNAGRVELRHKGETTDARVYIGKTDPTFTNNASLLMPGRVEGGMKVTQKLAPTVSLIGQGVISEDVSQHGSRKGVRVDVEKAFGNYRVELGFRHSEETQTPATPSMRGLTPNEVTSLRAKFTAPVPKVKNASLYGEYENDVVEPDKRMVAVGADYQTGSRSKLYARHEFISALGGPFELNTVQRHNRTVAGMETEYMKDGQLFNEYRMRDALTGREAEAATGLRNLWHVAEGVRLNTTFERVSPFTGSAQSTESTAGTAAIEVTPDADWKATARLELRTSTATDSLLNTLAYARKLSRDWTFLGRTILFLSESKGSAGAAHNQGRIQLGMAYRQTAKDIWNGLIKYEVKYEEGAVKPGADVRRKVHMLTGDANYQPTADWVFNLHYAGKLAIEDLGRASLTSHAHLAGTRALYQLTKRWDVGLNGNALFDGDLRSVQFAAGPEVGFTLRANARVGLGFNVIGFRDEDLAEDGFTNPGLFVSLRLKFDEGLLGRGNNSRQPAKP
jgi:hypothetical protein